MDYILSFTPMLSIRPDRISLTQLVSKKFRNALGFYVTKEVAPLQAGETPALRSQVDKPILEKKFHNFEISVNSARNLKDKVSYLFQFAKPRNIKTVNGKNLLGFKVCFLTLTLPSKQVHTTAEITKTCLDDFLQKLRKHLGMQNYVWRMEFQANGNVHYHICTDTYIDYYYARKEWNKSLNQLGYVSAYASRMQSMPFWEYQENAKNGKYYNPEKCYKTYLEGKKHGWQQPNSVDVKNAKSSDNIGSYISKYFSKKEKTAKCNALDNESNAFALRLCFWSRSLSRCKSESMPLDYYSANIVELFRQCQCAREIVFDYCRVMYYSFYKLPAFLKELLGRYFTAVMSEADYIPAS